VGLGPRLCWAACCRVKYLDTHALTAGHMRPQHSLGLRPTHPRFSLETPELTDSTWFSRRNRCDRLGAPSGGEDEIKGAGEERDSAPPRLG
jgi:hypothetical protein